MARLGLDDAALVAINPKLIRLEISGYGPDGPGAGDKVYDAVIQAEAGVAASHRDQHTGHPGLVATLLVDKLTALTAAQAATAALLARERDGLGRRVEVSMLDAALAFQWPDAMYNHVFIDAPPAPFPEIGATQKPWPTRDGFVATMNPQQNEFKALCAALGQPQIGDDPRFASGRLRNVNALALRETLAPLIASFTNDELQAACRLRGAPLGRVNERQAVVDAPQVRHNQAWVEIDHGDLGPVRLARAAARFDGAALANPSPAAHLGEHGAAVLAELGFDAAQVARWVAEKAVILG